MWTYKLIYRYKGKMQTSYVEALNERDAIFTLRARFLDAVVQKVSQFTHRMQVVRQTIFKGGSK